MIENITFELCKPSILEMIVLPNTNFSRSNWAWFMLHNYLWSMKGFNLNIIWIWQKLKERKKWTYLRAFVRSQNIFWFDEFFFIFQVMTYHDALMQQLKTLLNQVQKIRSRLQQVDQIVLKVSKFMSWIFSWNLIFFFCIF